MHAPTHTRRSYRRRGQKQAF